MTGAYWEEMHEFPGGILFPLSNIETISCSILTYPMKHPDSLESDLTRWKNILNCNLSLLGDDNRYF